MATPDIRGAKRMGLPVDFERLARVGDTDLTPEERYALKTHGVCPQLQDHVFMIRVRVPGGLLQPDQARRLVERGVMRGTGSTSRPARTSSCTGSPTVRYPACSPRSNRSA